MQVVIKRKYEDLLQSFQCPLCLGVCSDPVQCENGCTGCRKCFKDVAESGASKEFNCPLCRSSKNFFPNLFMKNMGAELTVKCKNKSEKGILCKHVFSIADADKHDDECLHKIVSCKNRLLGCMTSVRRSALSSHEEACLWSTMFKCATCEFEFRYGSHTHCHLEEEGCIKCSKNVKHCSMLLHTAECRSESPVCFWPGCIESIVSDEHMRRNPLHASVQGMVVADSDIPFIDFACISFSVSLCPECGFSVSIDCNTCFKRVYPIPPLKLTFGDKSFDLNTNFRFALEGEKLKFVITFERPPLDDSNLCLYNGSEIFTSGGIPYHGFKRRIRINNALIKKCISEVVAENFKPRQDTKILIYIYLGVTSRLFDEADLTKLQNLLTTSHAIKRVNEYADACKWFPLVRSENVSEMLKK